MLTQVQESVQPLVNAALLIFTGPAAAEQPLMPAFAPIVLPSQRAVTGVISDKPPGIESDENRFLNYLNCNMEVAVNNLESSPVIHSAGGNILKPLQ